MIARFCNVALLMYFVLTPGPLVLAADSTQTRYLGQTAPGFSLPDLQGKMRDVKDWRGKIVVLNFWASWCGPCRKEIPMFNAVQKEYGTDDVQFVGLAVDNIPAIRKFMDSVPIHYPVLVGGMDALDLVSQYGNVHGTLPYTVFIDRKGKIAVIVSGLLTREYVVRTIERLL